MYLSLLWLKGRVGAQKRKEAWGGWLMPTQIYTLWIMALTCLGSAFIARPLHSITSIRLSNANKDMILIEVCILGSIHMTPLSVSAWAAGGLENLCCYI